MQNRIYSLDSAKAIKARGFGYLNAIHYMAPAKTSGRNLCSHASPECIAACLGWFSGQAGMVANDADLNSVRRSRIEKAQRFMQARAEYLWDMAKATALAYRAAKAKRKKLCVRLNGSTDIAWEGVAITLDHAQAQWLARITKKPVAAGRYKSLFALFDYLQFVDYTKNPDRFARALPTNLHLTFSRSETNEAKALEILRAGHNVAVVFSGGLPATWRGFPVINGDEHDLRHLDPRGGYVVGLSPKGSKAKKAKPGFVVQAEGQPLVQAA